MSASRLALLIPALWIVSMPAAAYVGPGAGLSMIGSLVGVLSVLALAGVGVLLYPLQGLRKRLRRDRPQEEADITTDAGDPEAQPHTSREPD